jgi:beta-galactosidase
MNKLTFITSMCIFAIGLSITACTVVPDNPRVYSGQMKPRTTSSFNDGWKFMKHDADAPKIKGAQKADFDDSAWESIDLPHDWAILGPFTEEVDSAEGRLPFPGVGWYRKTFKAPAEGKHVFIEFDGVMKDAQVWLNGKKVGAWPYGYSSFSFELTDHLKYDGQKNVIAIRCENQIESSRWYPGSGIYRNVRLTVVEPVHVAHWGTYVTTPNVSNSRAIVKIQTLVENQTSEKKGVVIETTIIDAGGNKVAANEVSGKINFNASKRFTQKLKVSSPIRWDIDNPHLYKAITLIKTGGKVADEYETNFGIRTFRFEADKGFFLNGRNMKIHGVNLHHGLGPLGTAVSRRAIERQLEIMKEMGCNAIRTAHNPPAPQLLELCDRMGLLVMDEAFDEWHKGKVPNGYHNIFDEWAQKDIRAMVRRDKNHPSIILWSIGNEIVGLGTSKGSKITKMLADVCRNGDPTRPVSIGNSAPYDRVKDSLKFLDVVGWNYRQGTGQYDEKKRQHLKQVATETCALVSSRGVYFFPVKKSKMESRDGQISSYDLTNLGFGGLPDDEFRAQEEFAGVAGEFVWSGFDYLGEPEPCEDIARSTYFGIVDLCGFPKDRFYLYQSQWTDEPMVHLLPHWNWEGREGQVTPVYCYTNCESAELFVNGRSLGKKSKQNRVYRLKWEDVKYQPGSIKAVAYDKTGRALCNKEIRTAGEPARIELIPDRTAIDADGRDLCFVTVKIVDKDGIFCPTADNRVNFKIAGPGQIAAVGNGDSMSYESFRADHRKAFNGLCLLVIRSEQIPGKIKVTATSDHLRSALLLITANSFCHN